MESDCPTIGTDDILGLKNEDFSFRYLFGLHSYTVILDLP